MISMCYVCNVKGDYVPQLCDVVRIFPKLLREIYCNLIQLPLVFESPFLEFIPANGLVVNLQYKFPGNNMRG